MKFLCLLWLVVMAAVIAGVVILATGFAHVSDARTRLAQLTVAREQAHRTLLLQQDRLRRLETVRLASPATPPIFSPPPATAPNFSLDATHAEADLAERRREMFAAVAQLRWRRALASLGLAEPKIMAVLGCIANQAQIRADLIAQLPPGKRPDLADPSASRLVAEINASDASLEDDLRALLGLSDYERFDRLRQTAQLSAQADSLAFQLATTDTPLTKEQSDRYVQILLTNGINAKGQSSAAAIKWDAVLAQAGDVLTPNQLATLTTIVEHDAIWHQLNRINAAAR